MNRPVEQHQVRPTLALWGPRRRERKRERQRRPEKSNGEMIAENVPKMKTKRVTQVQEGQRLT